MKKLSVLLGAFVCMGLVACGGEKDGDKIGDAQICLDGLANPTSAEVDACLEKIDGISSAGADSIRCAGGFIREGFGNAQRFVDAMSAIDGNSSGSNVQTLMGLLTFASNNSLSVNHGNAVSTFNSCLSSGGKGSTLLASYTYLTMSMVKFYNGRGAVNCSSNPSVNGSNYRYYDLTACINGGVVHTIDLLNASTNAPDAIEAQNGIGAVIISAYVLSCRGSSTDSPLCELMTKSIDAAGGTSSPRDVSVKFFEEAVGL